MPVGLYAPRVRLLRVYTFTFSVPSAPLRSLLYSVFSSVVCVFTGVNGQTDSEPPRCVCTRPANCMHSAWVGRVPLSATPRLVSRRRGHTVWLSATIAGGDQVKRGRI